MTAHDLLSEIERYVSKAGIAETTFGLRVMNDGKFVASLRKGRRVWPETEGRVRDFIAAHPNLEPTR